MKEFEFKPFGYEVVERKNLASQAKHKKNGVKSKKCSLPSDRMTQKQWKERNGKVMEYNLSKPMSWERFRSLPKDLQQQYIEKLQADFDASIGLISTEMFGLAYGSLNAYLTRKGIPYKSEKRKRTKASMATFIKFCKGDAEEAAEQDAPAEEELTEAVAVEAVAEEIPVEVKPEPAAAKKAAFTLDNFTLEFSGEFDPDAIRNSLAMIL